VPAYGNGSPLPIGAITSGVITYRIEPGPVAPHDDAVVVHAPQGRVLLITREGTIIAADPAARRLLAELGAEESGGLDGPIATAVQAWLGSAASTDLIAMPLPGVVVRAIRLDETCAVAVVLETARGEGLYRSSKS
jgi:hypothetical protein